jgi:hypothetical protein
VEEYQLWKQVNDIRQSPTSYIQTLNEVTGSQFSSAQVQNGIAFLKNQKAVQPLEWSILLSQAAKAYPTTKDQLLKDRLKPFGSNVANSEEISFSFSGGIEKAI